MEALMNRQDDPFAAILAWEDDRPFPRDFKLAAECSKRAGVLAIMADMQSDEVMRTHAFAALLRAMVLSDCRIGAMGSTLEALRRVIDGRPTALRRHERRGRRPDCAARVAE